MKPITLFILILTFLLPSNQTLSAEISADKWVVTIEGKIERGDYEKLISILKKQTISVVSIFSTGGDFFEAIKIGKIIRKLKITVHTALEFPDLNIFQHNAKSISNAKCVSACFLVWVSGAKRGGNIVGIHRPYLSNNALKNMKADDAEALYVAIREATALFLSQMGVHKIYLDKMFSTPSTDVNWLTIDEIQNDFGPLSGMDEWTSSKCYKIMSREDLARYNVFWNKLMEKPNTLPAQTLSKRGMNEYTNLLGKELKFQECKTREWAYLIGDTWHEWRSSIQ